MDTVSLYWTLTEENPEDVIASKKGDQWNVMSSRNCTDNFTANATDNFFPEYATTHTRNMIRGNLDSLRNRFDVQNCCVYTIKCKIAIIERVISTNSAAEVRKKGLKKTVVMDQCQSIPKGCMNLSI